MCPIHRRLFALRIALGVRSVTPLLCHSAPGGSGSACNCCFVALVIHSSSTTTSLQSSRRQPLDLVTILDCTQPFVEDSSASEKNVSQHPSGSRVRPQDKRRHRALPGHERFPTARTVRHRRYRQSTRSHHGHMLFRSLLRQSCDLDGIDVEASRGNPADCRLPSICYAPGDATDMLRQHHNGFQCLGEREGVSRALSSKETCERRHDSTTAKRAFGGSKHGLAMRPLNLWRLRVHAVCSQSGWSCGGT